MIQIWLMRRAIRFLHNRGFLVIESHVPQLVVSYGTGTMQKHDDGYVVYTIEMPPGHKLVALFNTVLTNEELT